MSDRTAKAEEVQHERIADEPVEFLPWAGLRTFLHALVGSTDVFKTVPEADILEDTQAEGKCAVERGEDVLEVV